MNYNNNYPVQQSYGYYPQSTPNLIFIPQMGNKRMNRSVSVIAIVLIVALLFVGMKFINDGGVYEEIKVVWNRGYIDDEGLGVFDKGAFGNISFRETKGMYTRDAIAIKEGVKIQLNFDSELTYIVYVYNENDGLMGYFTAKDGKYKFMTNLTLRPDDFTGEFAKAQYIRIYAYPREMDNNDKISFGGSRAEQLTFIDWLMHRSDITISRVWLESN